ncbi:MAG TPA: hypothetical protein VFS41_01740 [Edaphobacter sp.]|nr:hypothetical protein [Edaphobacter sp.]
MSNAGFALQEQGRREETWLHTADWLEPGHLLEGVDERYERLCGWSSSAMLIQKSVSYWAGGSESSDARRRGVLRVEFGQGAGLRVTVY